MNLSIQSLRLIDLYKLQDFNFSNDEAVQAVVNKIVAERQQELINKHLVK